MALGRSKLAHQAPAWAGGSSQARPRGPLPWIDKAQVTLGFWLALSGFLWPHGDVAKFHGLLLGLSLVVTSAWRMRMAGRPLDLITAGWLLFATPLIHHECPLTAWHNLALSFIMVLTALSRDAVAR